MRTPSMIGVALALVCLVYVLYPIVGAGRTRVTKSQSPAASRRASPTVTDEEIEAAIAAYRTAHPPGADCSVCGPRPEADAVFCSNCGRRLGGGG
jgi:hypothetical protein